MKNNVINPSVPFDGGKIDIIGLTYDMATGTGLALIRAVSSALSGFRDPELEGGFIPEFCGKCLLSVNPEDSFETVMVFEYSFKGELRDAKKLLRSLRNKLAHEAYCAEEEIEKQHEYRELMNQGGLTMAEAQDQIWPHP